MKTIDQLYEYLKTTKRFVGSHDVHTPRALVEEILDHIDLVDKSILVLFNLEFVVSLVYNKHIDPAHITLYADHENKVKLAEKIGVKYITSLDTDMKFDVVIGNPPYLKGKWIEFLKKSVELTTQQVTMISPDGTNNFSTRSDNLVNFLNEHGIQSKTDCTSHFPNVNSGNIVIYNLDITKSYNPAALVDTTIEGKIVSKIINSHGNKLQAMLSSKRGKLHSAAIRYDNPSHGLIKNLESVTKTGAVYSWIDSTNTTIINAADYWLVNRYFGKDAHSTIVETSELIGISSNILAIKKIPGWTAEYFKQAYLSKCHRFTLAALRKGGFDTSPRHLSQLSIVEKYTDAELYQHFNLTQDEINYVESHVK